MHIQDNVLYAATTYTMTSDEDKSQFCHTTHDALKTAWVTAKSAHSDSIGDLRKTICQYDEREIECHTHSRHISATNKTPGMVLACNGKLQAQRAALRKLNNDVEKKRVKCVQAKAAFAESEANFASLVQADHTAQKLFRLGELSRMKRIVHRHMIAEKFDELPFSEQRAVARAQMMITHMPLISKIGSITQETKEAITDVSWGTVIMPLVFARRKKNCKTKEALSLLSMVNSMHYHVVGIDNVLSVIPYADEFA
jgi:hypothetical protein